MPNLHMRRAFFEGDEAQAGNLPPTEKLGPRTFTTDRFGFRQTPPVRSGAPIELVVFRGFSFVFGVGLSDEQTFPAALSRSLGVNAYNAARFHGDAETPEDFDLLMKKVGARPATVVYVHLESNAHTLSSQETTPNRMRRIVHFAKEYPLAWFRMSPVILNAVEAKKLWENDILFTNRYRNNVRAFSLPDGRPILVRAGDLERAETEFESSVIAERAEYVAWWNARIAERGARMTVLLVPDKISVYGRALGVKLPDDSYLDRLERELRARGVHVVNGLSVLSPRVNEDLASGRLSYLREDQHWNVLGVERLAKATADAVQGASRETQNLHGRSETEAFSRPVRWRPLTSR
jgi:hypothetical protein